MARKAKDERVQATMRAEADEIAAKMPRGFIERLAERVVDNLKAREFARLPESGGRRRCAFRNYTLSSTIPSCV
eukprot:5606400-Pleurochrysis_carterae.AAC.1